MTSSTVTGRRGGPVVGLLVLIWVLGLLASAWWVFSIGMRKWADSYSDASAETPALTHQAAGATLVLALVAVGGPAIIALVAYRLRLVRTAVVFLVLTLALLIPGLPAAAYAYRDLRPAPSPQPASPGHCQELSGGDNRCPGG